MSCGRRPPWPHYRDCPYCGELVRMPVWWRVARVGLVVALILLMGVLFRLSSPDFEEAREVLRALPTVKRFLLVSGVAVLLMPHEGSDVIVTSRVALHMWQLRSLAGDVFIGASLFFGSLCFAFASTFGVGLYLLFALVAVGLLALPCFYRLHPWRVGFALLLFLGVFVPLHRQCAALGL